MMELAAAIPRHGEISPASARETSLHSEDGFRPIAILLIMLLGAQLYLVWFKSFNWDEFLHFSQVYRVREGTLSQPFQVLHSRILWWAPEVAGNLIDQMRAARLFMWGTHLLTLFMIFGLARQFTGTANAFFAAFAYMTAGFVFAHGFSIRSDPLATATLMIALCLLGKGTLSHGKAIAIGALIGLAGMMTLKASFYVPCFAGLAWLKFTETAEKRQFLGKLAVLAATALASFAAIYLYHRSGLVAVPERLEGRSMFGHGLRWFSEGPKGYHIVREIILAPIFSACVVLAPIGWRKAGLTRAAAIALLGFALPLAVLLFYRNTFPYFFVFILAPVAVAIAPMLGMLRDRLGNIPLAILLAIVPVWMTAAEPRDTIGQQQALIDYVHQEYPERTSYLDYAGMIADYPRILNHLTSGIGIGSYHERGEATVAEDIKAGKVPFIIANHVSIAAALEGRTPLNAFLPADVAAMRDSYVRQWGALWREGKAIPSGSDLFVFSLDRSGPFTLAGDTVTLDGKTLHAGETIVLDDGRHLVTGHRKSGTVLWRGDRLPATPPKTGSDTLFTYF